MTTPKQPTGKWGDPPPARTPAYPWESIAALLRKNPGRWREVFKDDRTSLTIALRAGSIAALKPEDGFELRTSNNRIVDGKRRCTLHMRYVPSKEE